MFKRLIEKESSTILSGATIIMGATLLSAILGLLRTRLLIQYFYADKAVVDVFWAAFRLPDMVFQIIVVGALSSAFIPIFGRYLGKKNESNLIASAMINLVMVLMIILSVGIFIFARPLSQLIAGGFNSSQLDLMTNLTRIMALAQVFFGFSSFLTGVIQSHKRFLIPALSPVLYNVGIILGIVIFGKSLGIYGAAIGVVMGALLHLLAQLPLAHKLGFKYSFIWNSKHPAVKEMLHLMLPRVLTLSLIQIEATAIVTFSSWLSVGTVTIISIAQQLSGLPVRLIGVPIGQASLPFFTKITSQNDPLTLARMVNKTILEMLYLAFPASIMILVLRIPLVRLAYGADSFPWAETVLTGKLVAILSISIAARSLTHILVRVFYSLNNTTTPFLVNLIATALNIGLSYYLLFGLKSGVIGMAVAITIASLIETMIPTNLLYSLAGFARDHLLWPIFKMLTITAITAFSLWIPLRVLDNLIFDTTRTLPLILLTLTVGLIGLSVYIILSIIFKLEELAVFTRLARRIGGWQKVLSQSSETLDSSDSSV